MHFSFLAAQIFVTSVLAAIDLADLTTTADCTAYYDACTADGTCNTYQGSADGSCQAQSSGHAYGKCFFNHDDGYLANSFYKSLSLCLVENTKTLSDFTCFNNGTTVVDCDAEITNNMDFQLAPLGTDNVVANTRHDSVLNVNWGTLNVIVRPIDWDGCEAFEDANGDLINPCETALADKVPHMNLHACKITDVQTTCSAAMLENTNANATIDLTTNNLGDEGTHQLYIEFPSAGTWRLLGHIQIYEADGSKVMWDIANAVELDVAEKAVTPSPTIPVESENERKSGGNNVALIVCLLLVAICAGGCGYCYYFGVGDSDDDYDEADQDELYGGDGFVKVGDEKETDGPDGEGIEMGTAPGGKLPGQSTTTSLQDVPKMDHVSPFYAKLMANQKGGSRTPSPNPSPRELPPAPQAPGDANVV